jgi:hypothetical protein
LTSPPDPDHHAVLDPRRANFHHLRDTTRILFAVFTHENLNQGIATPFPLTHNS